MQEVKQVLSTTILSRQLIDKAAIHSIVIEEISFIETKKIENEKVKDKIENYLLQKITAVLTSVNAVNAVVKHLKQKPDWLIYCLGNTTKKLVESNFTENLIAGTADNAEQLTEIIIQDKIERVVFFCGDKRRDELPAKLKEHEIFVEEIVVYTTRETPVLLEKKYEGILFFSPSAVHSFFLINKVDHATQLFAIGTTTAKAILQYNKNNLIISHSPAKENLVRQMIAHFNTSKKDQTVL